MVKIIHIVVLCLSRYTYQGKRLINLRRNIIEWDREETLVCLCLCRLFPSSLLWETLYGAKDDEKDKAFATSRHPLRVNSTCHKRWLETRDLLMVVVLGTIKSGTWSETSYESMVISHLSSQSILLGKNLKAVSVFLDLCFMKTRAGKWHDYATPSFSKTCVFNLFSVRTKTTTRRFKISPFSWRIIV